MGGGGGGGDGPSLLDNSKQVSQINQADPHFKLDFVYEGIIPSRYLKLTTPVIRDFCCVKIS